MKKVKYHMVKENTFFESIGNNHVIPNFYPVDVMCCFYRFVCVNPFLLPWDKPHLVWLDDSFHILSDLIHWHLVEKFCIYFYQGYSSIISFFVGVPYLVFGLRVCWTHGTNFVVPSILII